MINNNGYQNTNPVSQDERHKLDSLVKSSHHVLFEAKTVFPFDFFPDHVIIDENKVDLIVGMFLLTEQVFSIPIKNINGSTASTDLFFGTLSIEIEGYNENPPQIKFLWRNHAIRARRIINGLAVCYKEGIDLTKFDHEEVKIKVEEIGKARDKEL